MANRKNNSALREGDTVETEWPQVSYDLWCRENARECEIEPGTRIVNIYDVVRSVIEQDLSPAERSVALMRWFDGLDINRIAQKTGTSTANIYKTVARASEKIKLVLKHIFYCEEYKKETDE